MADTDKTPHVQIFTAEMSARMEEIAKGVLSRTRRLQELQNELRELRYSHSPTTDVEKTRAIETERADLEAEDGKVKAEAEKLMILQAIQTKLDLARPYIELGREIAQVAPAEIVDILKIVADAGLDILEGMEGEIQRLTTFVAKQRRHEFMALTGAGFNEEQAMQLLLAGIGRQSVLATAMTQAASAGRGNKK